jgi:hypothetical protein
MKLELKNVVEGIMQPFSLSAAWPVSSTLPDSSLYRILPKQSNRNNLQGLSYRLARLAFALSRSRPLWHSNVPSGYADILTRVLMLFHPWNCQVSLCESHILCYPSASVLLVWVARGPATLQPTDQSVALMGSDHLHLLSSLQKIRIKTNFDWMIPTSEIRVKLHKDGLYHSQKKMNNLQN